MTPTPTQIATQAAEAYYKQMHEYCGAYRQDAPDLAALILSAAAKMVQQSGAVEALESCGEAIYRGDTYQHFDEQKVHAALQSLRSISEGGAK